MSAQTDALAKQAADAAGTALLGIPLGTVATKLASLLGISVGKAKSASYTPPAQVVAGFGLTDAAITAAYNYYAGWYGDGNQANESKIPQWVGNTVVTPGGYGWRQNTGIENVAWLTAQIALLYAKSDNNDGVTPGTDLTNQVNSLLGGAIHFVQFAAANGLNQTSTTNLVKYVLVGGAALGLLYLVVEDKS
jgi:hypothetical protein